MWKVVKNRQSLRCMKVEMRIKMRLVVFEISESTLYISLQREYNRVHPLFSEAFPRDRTANREERL